MFIADDVFLLLTTERGTAASGNRAIALAGAAISDLALHGRIEIGPGKNPDIGLLDSRPVGHPVPDHVLAYIAERIVGKGKRVRLGSVMQKSGFRLDELAGRTLAATGIVGVEERQLGGLIPMRFPLLDPRPGGRLRARLGAVLRGDAYSAPEAIDLSILQGVDAVRKVLGAETAGLSRKETKARIAALECPAELGPAVKNAVDAVMLATMIPVFVAAGVAAGTTG